ncbi:hypothetical protein IPL85_05275 [Candidatus Saccharibacteria bacterium]|nr:MAG: hypothetical protein IPL85_05275 [Candidatus Saccharibacteria bacterium]
MNEVIGYNNVSFYGIAGGETRTAIVPCASAPARIAVAEYLISRGIERVGFLGKRDASTPVLEMMVGNLSINVTLAAAASLVGNKGVFDLLGMTSVKFNKSGDWVTIELNISHKVYPEGKDNVVLINNIGHVVTPIRPNEEQIRRNSVEYSNKYGCPPLGTVWFSPGGIVSYEYVQATNTCAKFPVCGTGSLAAYLTSDGGKAGVACDINQTTGQAITIRRGTVSEQFAFTAKVSDASVPGSVFDASALNS